MKKYITIAALLAAGTACANAETGADFNAVLEEAFANYELGDAFSIYAELSSIQNQNKGFITLADSYYVVNQGHVYWGLNNKSSNVLSGNNEWKLSVSGNDYTYTSTDKVLPILWTQNANGNASATRSTGSTLTVTISSDGTDSTVKLAYADSSIVDTFILKGTALDATEIKFAENIGSVANADVTVVPEPSAFGLLAGIGALALVASRRRRK